MSFRLQRPEPPEQAIQDAVLRFLAIDRRVAWAQRFNTGAMRVEGQDARGRRTRRFVQFAFKGCSDILGQLTTGHLIACEIKRPSTKPTREQAAFLATVESNGGLAVVARSVEDVERALAEFVAQPDTPSRAAGSRPSGQTEHGQRIGGVAGQGARPALEPGALA
ncbi:hypothetical protein CKO31_18220 [Thiohalocapsa halophila]|uniref:VRR-NUC domain-containing protein n=1 Tax=Thiohalocapsa halophila TaxID=69359 RepID=A0ABS1CL48_9GAMM|nr:hypothetical protein [Thiohalocapsa halophila]MBK1632642.1 hypothetical protein [Thiohalocapsa halophila]